MKTKSCGSPTRSRIYSDVGNTHMSWLKACLPPVVPACTLQSRKGLEMML